MKLFLFPLLSFTMFAAYSQQPGTLDKTFGADGKVLSNFSFYNCNAVTVNNEQKILAAGNATFSESVFGEVVAQYNADGSLDVAFGDSGRAKAYTEGKSFTLVVQEDSKIITAGSNNGRVQLIRYNKNGTLDQSFGEKGVVEHYIAPELNYSSVISDIALQKDGRIVATGYGIDRFGGNGSSSFVIRYNNDGSLDKSFADTGILLSKFNLQVYYGLINLQKDGKILAAGNEFSMYDGIVYLVARYLTDGTLDKSFGEKGIARFIFSNKNGTYAGIGDMALQPDDKIIIAGQSGTSFLTDQHLTVVRFNADGTIDSGFGTKGHFTATQLEAISSANSVLIQDNNKIIATGYSKDERYPYLAIRLMPEGILDSAFGENGIAGTSINKKPDGSTCSVLQNDGKIVLAGGINGADEDASTAFIRINGDPQQEQNPLAKKIKRWIKKHILNWQGLQDDDVAYYSIEQSSNGIAGFKEIGRVKAKEQRTVNSEQPVYSFNVSNTSANSRQLTANSQTSYRIRAVSNDGSNIVSDIISDEDFSSVTVSPNPVKDVLKISGLPVNQKSTINIVSRNGNVLQSAICNTSIYNINVAQLHAGLYNVQVVINGKTQTVKFVKE